MKQVGINEALAHKYPEWIILVVARDREGWPNLMPAGWGMICSGQPHLVAVATAPQRHAHRTRPATCLLLGGGRRNSCSSVTAQVRTCAI